jgi:hypothetical protein
MTTPPKILKFDPQRRLTPTAAQRARDLVERALGAVVGLAVFLFGGGLLWLVLLGPQEIVLAALVPAAALAVIALFGLNLLWQSLRGAGRQEGFFYDGLRALSRLPPPAITLGIPALLTLSVLVSAAFGSPRGLSFSLEMLTTWLMIAAHIALHEAGHYLAAVGVGLAPRRVVIGPLELTRPAQTWRSGLCQEWFSLIGGLVEAEAPGRLLTAREELRFALGGPLATLLLLATLLIWNPYDLLGLLKMAGGPRNVIFSVGLGAGFMILLLNLLPMQSTLAGIPSDGYRIYSAVQRLRAVGER